MLKRECGQNFKIKVYRVESTATAELCLNMDKFFDIMNIRNESEGVKKRKPFLNSFRNINDERFLWLQNEFLVYLENGKSSVEREKEISVEQNEIKCFYHIKRTKEVSVYSIIESVKFLIQDGMKFVIRNENPSLHQYGYDSNTLRMARSMVPMKGNTKGKYSQQRSVSVVC